MPPEGRGARATSHEGPGDATTQADPTEADTAGADTIDLAKPATPEPTKPKTKPVARVSTLRRGDTPAPAGSPDKPNRPMGRRPGKRDRRGRGASRNPLGIRTGVLAGIAAVLFVIAAILAFHPGAEIGPNKAFVDQESTSQLTSQAQERICAVFGYDHTELDEWQRRAQDALTGPDAAVGRSVTGPVGAGEILTGRRVLTDRTAGGGVALVPGIAGLEEGAERGADHAGMDDQRHRAVCGGMAPVLDQGGCHARAEVVETLAARRSVRRECRAVQNADVGQRVKGQAVMRAKVLLP